MPCEHRFASDLQLQYVDWKPKTLFIGTFNPEWRECENNDAQWFYGRTKRNEFWCILPRVFQQDSLLTANRQLWIDFCRNNNIAITDILQSINADVNDLTQKAAVCKFEDDKLKHFEVTINNIPTILDTFPTIKQICITRKTVNKFWKTCFHKTFKYIELNPERNISLKFLRSPSRGARKGVVGVFCHFISQKWIEQGFDVNP